MKIMDIHSHSWYSGCGRDDPRRIIHAAIEGKIELFGIADHNYGIADRKRKYYNEMQIYKEEYKNDITLLCGIEIATLPHLYDVVPQDIEGFDYCLLEQIDADVSLSFGKLFDFKENLEIKTGIAHTDLFRMAETLQADPLDFFSGLAKHDIFWEMNVNYDSIHSYREHAYVKELFENEWQQEVIRKSGIRISVGFDGHRTEDYLPERIHSACKTIESLGFKTADEYLLQ